MKLKLHFLGETSPHRVTSRKTGEIRHARYMYKTICSMKIFIIGDEFLLSDIDRTSLKKMCIFLIRVYLDTCYETTNAIKAPLSDLHLIEYEVVDK